MTGPAVNSLRRFFKAARLILLSARRIREAALQALRDGGDALPGRAPLPPPQGNYNKELYEDWARYSNGELIEQIYKGMAALECLRWRLPGMEARKRKPGKPATPALNAAYLGLFFLFQKHGLLKNKARNYTGGLLYAAALTNTPDGDAVKAKLSTLKS